MYRFNEDAFKELSQEVYYWAGFIAADGCIAKNGTRYRLSIALSTRDRDQLERFVKFLKSDHKVHDRVSKEGMRYSQLHIYSNTIISDLLHIFNITPRKSLTFVPPVIHNNELKDAFILGYIDGDGSVNLTTTKKGAQKSMQLSVVGTKEMIEFINQRFAEILGRGTPKKAYLKTKSGIYHTVLSSKIARRLFTHFEAIDLPKMERKWGSPYKEHCQDWKPLYNPWNRVSRQIEN